jgi:hypothetical protein
VNKKVNKQTALLIGTQYAGKYAPKQPLLVRNFAPKNAPNRKRLAERLNDDVNQNNKESHSQIFMLYRTPSNHKMHQVTTTKPAYFHRGN